MRETKQRQIILQVLRNTTLHPSADELYLQVKQQIPSISLGTVYRNLERLVQEKLILKIVNLQGQRRFDANIIPHGHFCCVKCGKIEDLPFEMEFPEFPKDSAWFIQREIIETCHEIRGLCPDCKVKA